MAQVVYEMSFGLSQQLGVSMALPIKSFKYLLLKWGSIHPFETALVLKHNYGCSQLGDDHENTKPFFKMP